MSGPRFETIEAEIDLNTGEVLGTQSQKISVQTETPEKQEQIQVEVVDDTPEKDRGKSRPEPLKDPPKGVIPDEDELQQYSESVQKRMKRMTYEFHEQRRQREAAEREASEAARILKQIYEENQKLRQTLVSGEKLLVDQAKGRVEAQIESVKDKLRKAHENGDTEALVLAQEELSRLSAQKVQVDNYQPQQAPERPAVQQQRPQPQKPQVDPEAERWAKKNDWFQRDQVMTGAAFGVHEKIVKEMHIDPRRDPEAYYATLDKEMRKAFPSYNWGDEPREQPRKAPASVVAPATRSVTSGVSSDGKSVKLTTSQVALAKRLGITPQEYAAQVIKMARDQ